MLALPHALACAAFVPSAPPTRYGTSAAVSVLGRSAATYIRAGAGMAVVWPSYGTRRPALRASRSDDDVAWFGRRDDCV